MSKDKVCTIYLVRHGESKANVDKIVQGHTDSPLTENGVKQAEEIRDKFSQVLFGAIYSSDLMRAKRTADIIAAGRGIAVRALPGLREKYFGDFEGKDNSEFVETLKDEFHKFENLLSEEEMWEHKAHPSMESDKELLVRARSALQEIANMHIGENVLVVTHRYLIRMILVSFGHGSYKNLKDGALKTGGYAIVDFDGGNFIVIDVVGAEA